LSELANAVSHITGDDGADAPFRGLGSACPSDQLAQLAAPYLARIKRPAPWAARVTDKMPSNFRFVCLIHLALPFFRAVCRDKPALQL
jgi:hypothetical protein